MKLNKISQYSSACHDTNFGEEANLFMNFVSVVRDNGKRARITLEDKPRVNYNSGDVFSSTSLSSIALAPFCQLNSPPSTLSSPFCFIGSPSRDSSTLSTSPTPKSDKGKNIKEAHSSFSSPNRLVSSSQMNLETLQKVTSPLTLGKKRNITHPQFSDDEE